MQTISEQSGVAGEGEAVDVADLRRRAARGGVILVGSRLGTQLITWVVTIQVARLLTPFDYGVLATGGIFIGLGDLLAEAGIGRALVRKPSVTPEDEAEGFTVCLVLAIVLYAALFMAAGMAADWLRNPALVSYLRVSGLVLLLVPFRIPPMAILERRLLLGRLSAYQVASAVIQSCLVLALAAAGFGYWAPVGGVLVGRSFETAALMRITSWAPRLRPPGASARELLSFGGHITGASLLYYTYKSSDFAILSKISGPIALGYYSLAYQISSIPVDRLCSGFNQTVYPVLCRVQHDRRQARDWYLRIIALLAAIALPSFVGLALVAGDLIVVVVGEKWMPAVVPLRLMCVASPSMVFNATLFTVFAALGRPNIATRFNAACAVVLPAGFLIMGQRHGTIGVCLFWATAYPAMSLVMAQLCSRVLGVGLIDLARSLAPALKAVAAMAAAVLLARWPMASANPSPARLAWSITVGVASYGLSLRLLARDTVVRDFLTLGRELGGRRAPPPGPDGQSF